MNGRIVTHKDGSQSVILDGSASIEILKNKETAEEQRSNKVRTKDVKKVKFNKGKVKSKD